MFVMFYVDTKFDYVYMKLLTTHSRRIKVVENSSGIPMGMKSFEPLMHNLFY